MTTAALPVPTFGWLRNRRFDLLLVVGVTTLALGSGALVWWRPSWFPIVLMLDLWLLGYHHVASTFTRLAFDKESFREHRFLVLGLPWLVAVGVIAGALWAGPWLLATTYLYWQWFHYTRQSYGIERAYRARATGAVVGDPRLARAALYLLPLWGILHRSHQEPETFLGMPLKVLPVPSWLVPVAAAAAIATIVLWAAQVVRSLASGARLQAHSVYFLSHFAVFYAAYVGFASLDVGWLVVNVWHNAQYILFVWHFNNRRFRGGVEPGARLLSALSQTRNMIWYVVTVLGLSTVAYFGVDRLATLLEARTTLPVILIVYQALNFHHYVVDGVIWKLRKKALRRNLDLDGAAA
jgi:hypothetical protein